MIFAELSSSGNFLFSPYSLHSVLSQIMFGAGGQTRAQLAQLLGVRTTEATLSQWRDLSLGLTRGSAQLSTANQLAVARGFKPKPAFNQLLGRVFQSTITEYDFAGNRGNAVQQVELESPRVNKSSISSSVLSLCQSLSYSKQNRKPLNA